MDIEKLEDVNELAKKRNSVLSHLRNLKNMNNTVNVRCSGADILSMSTSTMDPTCRAILGLLIANIEADLAAIERKLGGLGVSVEAAE